MNITQQPGWNVCLNCGGEFYTLRAYPLVSCKANNAAHFFSGNPNHQHPISEFAVWVDYPAVDPGTEANWAYCKKCQGLFRIDNSQPNQCFVGPGGYHDRTGSGNYVLARKTGAPPAGTVGFYYRCMHCQLLYAAEITPTYCNVHGQHDHTPDEYYSLDVIPANPPVYTTYTISSPADTLWHITNGDWNKINLIVEHNRSRYPEITPSFVKIGWVLEIPY